MPERMKLPALLSVSLVALVAIAIVVSGCGGGGSSGSGDEPASLAPQSAPVFIEANLAPEAKVSEELDEVTQKILGIDNVGEFITDQLEQKALGSGEKFNFEEEVEPWLGEKAGMYLAEYDGDNFHGYGVAIGLTNAAEAEEFIEKRVEANDEESEEGEFEGDKYFVEPEDESVLGVIGDYLAFGETLADFEEMVTTSEEGEGLNESEKFEKATEAAADQGIGSVYVDIGGLIEQAKGSIPPESEAVFDMVGIEPRDATVVATVLPHSEQVELDVTSNLGKAKVGEGDASALLESLPATATVGFATPEFGKSFGEGADELSENGIPGQIEPGELKPTLETVGIDLDSIAASIGSVGGFVEGTSKVDLGGAAVIETDSASEAKSTITHVGLLLRAAGTKGVTAVGGNLTGFSVHSAALGAQPLIVVAAGEKVVIAYGPRAATLALRENVKTLGSTAAFEAAKSALGSTPITAFAAGGPALKLVEGLLSPTDAEKFATAKPYLRKVTYAAVGAESKGSTTTAKVIFGLSK
jgi:hypothetical protein